MRTYTPTNASSYTSTGPDNRYTFPAGKPIGGKTQADEEWMDWLVTEGILRVVEDTNPKLVKITPKERVEEKVESPKLAEKPVKKITRPKGYKTKSDAEAEIEVAKVKEELDKAKEDIKPFVYDKEDIQQMWEYLQTLKGKNVEEMIVEIEANYFKKPLANLCNLMEINDEGNKPELALRIIDWFSGKVD